MAFRMTHGRERVVRLAEQRAALQALEIRNEAVLATPVDTGYLQQSIGLKKLGQGHYRVGTTAKYAPFVEFGTRAGRAQPFMRPALEKVRRA
ncbi:HK97-gp10 family putative phage morphogenesis protein [uncultured Deinococcus sp.]|uniref:HK97-gp10 family putative phage morphogenesis protein n=1 Tax=uncultured Deinococcus sp. TaxID=158789 RepID=UPI0025FA20B2|nr:HK97-gp10 family putative phage morphogenesis protein [uncultured Deinococcus sp.]